MGDTLVEDYMNSMKFKNSLKDMLIIGDGEENQNTRNI